MGPVRLARDILDLCAQHDRVDLDVVFEDATDPDFVYDDIRMYVDEDTKQLILYAKEQSAIERTEVA